MAKRWTITAAMAESLAPGQTVWDGEIRGFGVRRQRRDLITSSDP